MSTSSNANRGMRAKLAGAGGTAVAVGAYVIYILLTGNIGGLNDFTGQDLRDAGDRFRRQDLVESIFVEANVSGIDMTAANLHESDLREIIAVGTNMQQAIFRRADLRDGNFRDANLLEADFAYADLRDADFRGADLRGVSFEHANLEGVDFRNALGGPACEPRQSVPDHCDLGADNCCYTVWASTEIDGLRACSQEFSETLRRGQTVEPIGPVGEPQWSETIRHEGERIVCWE